MSKNNCKEQTGKPEDSWILKFALFSKSKGLQNLGRTWPLMISSSSFWHIPRKVCGGIRSAGYQEHIEAVPISAKACCWAWQIFLKRRLIDVSKPHHYLIFIPTWSIYIPFSVFELCSISQCGLYLEMQWSETEEGNLTYCYLFKGMKTELSLSVFNNTFCIYLC